MNASELTPDDMHLLELACAVRSAVLGGITAALLSLPFVDGGRALWLLIGG